MKIEQILKPLSHAKAGEIGLEIEVELDRELDLDEAPKGWAVDRDGSLRGNYSYEFKLRQPIKRSALEKYIESIYQMMDKNKPNDSDNCSVHVHVNCQGLEVYQIINFACLYYILEPVLLRRCGEHRTGNLFCLSGSDAEFQYKALGDLAQLMPNWNMDDLKYAALNLYALKAYGSLEFRSMRFPITKKQMSSWVNLLLELKDNSISLKHDDSLISKFSELGVEDFIAHFLPTTHKNLDFKGLEGEIREAMHSVQHIIYTGLQYKKAAGRDNIKQGGARVKAWRRFNTKHRIRTEDGIVLEPNTREYAFYLTSKVPIEHASISRKMMRTIINEDYLTCARIYDDAIREFN